MCRCTGLGNRGLRSVLLESKISLNTCQVEQAHETLGVLLECCWRSPESDS
jgi:hypothetical protein